jgi:hypothetical protein
VHPKVNGHYMMTHGIAIYKNSVVYFDENTVNVFHAMKCRKAWRDLAKLEKKLWQE